MVTFNIWTNVGPIFANTFMLKDDLIFIKALQSLLVRIIDTYGFFIFILYFYPTTISLELARNRHECYSFLGEQISSEKGQV